jgi:hypothetical protein
LDVPVSKPVRREVTEYVDYTGRTAAINSVDIRPRVTGYLVKMPFKEGSEVKAGDLLFEIDMRVVDGVNPDDRVVVGVLPQVRPLMQVEPEEVEMPRIGVGQAPAPVPQRPQPPPAGTKKQAKGS